MEGHYLILNYNLSPLKSYSSLFEPLTTCTIFSYLRTIHKCFFPLLKLTLWHFL